MQFVQSQILGYILVLNQCQSDSRLSNSGEMCRNKKLQNLPPLQQSPKIICNHWILNSRSGTVRFQQETRRAPWRRSYVFNQTISSFLSATQKSQFLRPPASRWQHVIGLSIIMWAQVVLPPADLALNNPVGASSFSFSAWWHTGPVRRVSRGP